MPTDTPEQQPSSRLNRFRTRLERGMRQPSMEHLRRPSAIFRSSHRRQKSMDQITLGLAELSIARDRASTVTSIDTAPDIDRVSNFSSPARSIGSMDSPRLPESSDASPPGSARPLCSPTKSPALSFLAPIPKISVTSADASPNAQPAAPGPEPSKLTRLRNRTRSLLLDPYQDTFQKSISPERARSSSIGDEQQRPPMSKTLSDTKQETIHSVEANESISKTPKKELVRKRSRTFGSLEGDLYHKRSGSIVKTIGSMVMLKQRASTEVPTGSSSDVSSDTGISHQTTSPAVEPEDTPESYVARLIHEGFESECSTIFSNDSSEFFKACLQLYIDQSFEFSDEPLDISLRRFLLICGLPKESQQIDRVLECFSKRYYDCNTGYWDNKDQIYLLAFSLVMLHTDHFNSNNKKKMTKDQFVKNTRVDDQNERTCNSFLTRELMEYFYDNITLTRFIQKDQIHPTVAPPIYSLPKRIFSSNSSTNLEAMSSIRHQTTRSQSISSSTSQFFNNQNIADVYHYILMEQVTLLRLDLDQISDESPFENKLTYAFPQSYLKTIRDSFVEENGKFLRFNKECNWIPGRTELMFKDTEEIEHSPRCVLRVIKFSELYREETQTNKFFVLGNVPPRVIWKKCYGMLTMCGFFIFDNLNFIPVPQREMLLSKDTLEEPMVIDVLSENSLRSCTKLSINGLFACQATVEEANTHHHHTSNHLFSIFSTNKKEIFSTETFAAMTLWIISINHVASLDSCYMDYATQFDHEVVPIRNISVGDKVSKLIANIPASKKKIDELMRVQRHLRIVTPLSTKTREELMDHSQVLKIRMDWLWYEVERNQTYLSILRSELAQLQMDEKYSMKATDEEESFLEDSFINDDSADKVDKSNGKSKLNVVTGKDEVEEDSEENNTEEETAVLVNVDGTTEEISTYRQQRRELEDLIEEPTFISEYEGDQTKDQEGDDYADELDDNEEHEDSSDDEHDLFLDALDVSFHTT